MSFQLDLEVKLLHDVHDLWNRHRFLFYSLFELTTFNSLTNPTLPLPPLKCIVILSCMVFFWSLEISVFEVSPNSRTRKLWIFQFFLKIRFSQIWQMWSMTTDDPCISYFFFSNIVCFLDGWRFKHANRRAMTKVEKGRDSGKQ